MSEKGEKKVVGGVIRGIEFVERMLGQTSDWDIKGCERDGGNGDGDGDGLLLIAVIHGIFRV